MSSSPIQIVIQFMADARDAVTNGAKVEKMLDEVRASAAKAGVAVKESASSNVKLTQSNDKLAESAKRVAAAQQYQLTTQKQLATQQTFLSNAWKEGSSIVDRRYLSSIRGLREGMYRFNKEAKETVVFSKGTITSLDDASLSFERFMLKGNLATRTLDNMGRKLQDMGKNAQWTGRQMMVGITAPIMALGGVSVKSAMDVQRLDIDLKKVMDTASSDDFAKLNKQTKDLSVEFGIARTEIKGAQIDFARLGWSTENVIKGIRLAQEFSAVGDVDISVSQDLIRVLRQQGMAWKDLEDQLFKFNVMDDRTNMSLKKTADSLKDVFPTASQFGMSAAETAAVMSAITQRGFEASTAADGLRGSLVKLTTALSLTEIGESGGRARLKDLQDQLKAIGGLASGSIRLFNEDNTPKTGIELFKELGQIHNTLTKLEGVTGKEAQARMTAFYRALFGTGRHSEGVALIEAFSDLFDGATGKGRDLAIALQIAQGEVGQFAAEWGRQLGEVTGSDTVQIMGQIQRIINAGQELGTKLLPTVLKVVEGIAGVVETFTNLPDSLQNFILIAAGGLATLGPLLYVIGQAGIGLGTILRGAVFPAKSFFSLFQRHRETFEGAPDIAGEVDALTENFKDTGNIESYRLGMSKIIDRLDESAAQTDNLTGATNRYTDALSAQTSEVIRNAEAHVERSRSTSVDEPVGGQASLRERLLKNSLRERFIRGVDSTRPHVNKTSSQAPGLMSMLPDLEFQEATELSPEAYEKLKDRMAEVRNRLFEQQMQDLLDPKNASNFDLSHMPSWHVEEQERLANIIKEIDDRLAVMGGPDGSELEEMAKTLAREDILGSGLGSLAITNPMLAMKRDAEAKMLRNLKLNLEKFEDTFGYQIPISPDYSPTSSLEIRQKGQEEFARRVDAFLDSINEQLGGDGPWDSPEMIANIKNNLSKDTELMHDIFSNAIASATGSRNIEAEANLKGAAEAAIDSLLDAGNKDFTEYLRAIVEQGGKVQLPVRSGLGNDPMRMAMNDLATVSDAMSEKTGSPQLLTGEIMSKIRNAMSAGPDLQNEIAFSDRFWGLVEEAMQHENTDLFISSLDKSDMPETIANFVHDLRQSLEMGGADFSSVRVKRRAQGVSEKLWETLLKQDSQVADITDSLKEVADDGEEVAIRYREMLSKRGDEAKNALAKMQASIKRGVMPLESDYEIFNNAFAAIEDIKAELGSEDSGFAVSKSLLSKVELPSETLPTSKASAAMDSLDRDAYKKAYGELVAIRFDQEAEKLLGMGFSAEELEAIKDQSESLIRLEEETVEHVTSVRKEEIREATKEMVRLRRLDEFGLSAEQKELIAMEAAKAVKEGRELGGRPPSEKSALAQRRSTAFNKIIKGTSLDPSINIEKGRAEIDSIFESIAIPKALDDFDPESVEIPILSDDRLKSMGLLPSRKYTSSDVYAAKKKAVDQILDQAKARHEENARKIGPQEELTTRAVEEWVSRAKSSGNIERFARREGLPEPLKQSLAAALYGGVDEKSSGGRTGYGQMIRAAGVTDSAVEADATAIVNMLAAEISQKEGYKSSAIEFRARAQRIVDKAVSQYQGTIDDFGAITRPTSERSRADKFAYALKVTYDEVLAAEAEQREIEAKVAEGTLTEAIAQGEIEAAADRKVKAENLIEKLEAARDRAARLGPLGDDDLSTLKRITGNRDIKGVFRKAGEFDTSMMVGALSPEMTGAIREMIVTQTEGAVKGIDGAIETNLREAKEVIRKNIPDLDDGLIDEYAKYGLITARRLREHIDEAELMMGINLKKEIASFSKVKGMSALGASSTQLNTFDNLGAVDSRERRQVAGFDTDYVDPVTTERTSPASMGGESQIDDLMSGFANMLVEDAENKVISTSQKLKDVEQRLEEIRQREESEVNSFGRKLISETARHRRNLEDRVAALKKEQAEAVAGLDSLMAQSVDAKITADFERGDYSGISDAEKDRLLEQINRQEKNRIEIENARRNAQRNTASIRASKDVARANRGGRVKAALMGRSYSALGDDEAEVISQMHLSDIQSGRDADGPRRFNERDIQRYRDYQALQQVAATTQAGGTGYDVVRPDVPDDFMDMPVTFMERFKSSLDMSTEADVSLGPLEKLKAGASRIFGNMAEDSGRASKLIGDSLLDKAKWLSPVTHIKALGRGIAGVGPVMGKLQQTFMRASPLMAGIFPQMTGGVQAVIASAGPLAGLGPILLPIAAIVAGLALTWNKWKDAAAPGLEKLKSAGKALIDAVLAPMKGLMDRLFGGGKEGAEGMGSAFDGLGKAIGRVAEVVASVISFIQPVISFIMEWIMSGIYSIVQIFKAVFALITGDFKGFGEAIKKLWDEIWSTIGMVLEAGVSLVIQGIASMLKGIIAGISNLINQAARLVNWIPGVKVSTDGLRDSINEAIQSFADLSKTTVRDLFGRKDTYAARGRKLGSAAGKEMNDAAREEAGAEPPIDLPPVDIDGAIEEAKNAVSKFISAFQSQMRKITDGWKKAATLAFDEWAKSQVKALDDKIEAIDKEIKVERQRDQDLEYLRRKEELRNRRRSEQMRHTADRDLAIYEGRYDDAKQMDYDYGQTLAAIARDEEDLEKSRQQTLTDRLREASKERIEIEKKELQASLDIKKEQMQKQLDIITEYIPKNVAEAQKMHSEISNMMKSFTDGYGQIGAEQADAWGSNWSTAFEAAKKQIAEEAAWAGKEVMREFATALGIDPNLITDSGGGGSSGGSSSGSSGGGSGYKGSNLGNSGSNLGHVGAAPAIKPGVSSLTPEQLERASKGMAFTNDGRPGVYHAGGAVGSLAGGPADVPATLQTGEYVIKRSAVAAVGKNYLDQINEGHMCGPGCAIHGYYHEGGMVGMAKSAMSKVFNKKVKNWREGIGTFSFGGKDDKGDAKQYTVDHYKAALTQAAYGSQMGGGGWTSVGDTKGMSVAQIVDSVVSGIHPEFKARLEAWNREMGGRFNISRGYRTMAQQARLYDRWIRKVPGQALAAPPGRSMHNFGLAVDLIPATTTAAQRAAGAKYGLRWPMSFEPWHVEPNEAKNWRDSILSGFVPSGGGMMGADLDTGGLKLREGLINTGYGSPISPTSPGKDGLKGMVRGMMGGYGWGDDHWPALDKIVIRESGWNPAAKNPTSTAAGLFQFLRATWQSYITSRGGPAYWTQDPGIQAKGGLQYIKDRYGDPSKALDFHLRNKWYHEGGMVFPQMDVGGQVMRDGVAKVHAGETVLTAGLTNLLGEVINQGGGVGGDINVEINISGGFMGSQRDLENFVDTIETKVVPRIRRAQGMENRKIGSVTN